MVATYRNTSLLFAVILVFVIVAFFKTYFGLFPDFKGTTFLVHFHVAVLLFWFAMLIVQPVLIGTKRLKLHRLIGKASYFLVPLVVISLILMTRNNQMREKDLAVFTVNIFDVSMFILFYALAIIYKRNAAWHARFMILTVIPFISPAAARLQLPGIFIQLALLVGLLILEFFTGKVYKPTSIALSYFMTMLLLLGGLFILKPDVLDSLWSVIFSQS